MKFVADGMLGKLVRWLRMAGHDVVYLGDWQVDPEDQDEVLINMAVKDCRTLLTRDLDLHRRSFRRDIESIYIESDNIVEQLAEVSKNIDKMLQIDPRNSRCSMCNGQLIRAKKSEVKNEVPYNVLEKHNEFWKCLECNKVYWLGSHWKNIAKTVESYERLVK